MNNLPRLALIVTACIGLTFWMAGCGNDGQLTTQTLAEEDPGCGDDDDSSSGDTDVDDESSEDGCEDDDSNSESDGDSGDDGSTGDATGGDL